MTKGKRGPKPKNPNEIHTHLNLTVPPELKERLVNYKGDQDMSSYCRFLMNWAMLHIGPRNEQEHKEKEKDNMKVAGLPEYKSAAKALGIDVNKKPKKGEKKKGVEIKKMAPGFFRLLEGSPQQHNSIITRLKKENICAADFK